MPYKCSTCDKSFRYKVSQRNHKCNGVLIRQQTGDLLKKLLQTSLILSKGENNNEATENMIVNGTIVLEKSTPDDFNNALVTQQQPQANLLLEKPSTITSTTSSSSPFPTLSFSDSIKNEEMCLDEFVKESYNKLIIGNDNEMLKTITSNDSTIVQARAPPTSPSSSSSISLANQLLHDNGCLTPMHHSDNMTIPMGFSNLEIINDDSIKELLYGNSC